MKVRMMLCTGMVIALLGSVCTSSSYAQQIPTGQDIGARGQQFKKQQEQEKLRQRIKEPKDKTQIEDTTKESAQETPDTQGPRVEIDSIIVEGVTFIDQADIREIVTPYEGQSLTLGEMTKIADMITALYRERGYVTSFAYLIPQRITNKEIRIGVVEGKVGEVHIEGNKWFSTGLIERFLDQRKGELLNYDTLREKLNFINSKKDINTNVVLERGDDRYETDINVKVKDKFPFHATLGYNNYNSRLLLRNKYMMELESTNFLGLGHTLAGEIQLGEGEKYALYSARYLAPLNERHRFGANYIRLNQRLGREVGDLNIKGKGHIASLYYSYTAYETENLTVNVTPGFTYKDIDNEILGDVTSEDNVRIAKAGFDIDYLDQFSGRTILTQEFNFGIPDFMGGLEDKDANASRANAGGKFFTSVTNAARVQTLPYDLSLMVSGSMQLSNYNLPSSEQFFIGGPTTVRGYPNSEHGGDKGFNVQTELYYPIYCIPKEWKIPYTETTLYEALRGVVFFDWGFVSVNNVLAGEEKRNSLYSVGPALRFTIPNRLSVSFDYGFQLAQQSSDGSKSRGYVEVKLFF